MSQTVGVIAAFLVLLVVIALGTWAYFGWQRRFDTREQLRLRADQQNTWALEGDPRGVYGEVGARLMARFDRGGSLEPLLAPPRLSLQAERDAGRLAEELFGASRSTPGDWRILPWGGETIKVKQGRR